MPAFDFPLEVLEQYRGRNPRPEDFDAYWDDVVAELDAHDPEVRLEPNATITSQVAECFDLWFTGLGGARIYAQYVRPRVRSGAGPAVLQFHGYSGNSGDWQDKLGFVSEGFCVAAMDCRGQGGRSEDRGGVRGPTLRGQIIRGLADPDPKRLLFRAIFADTALLARIVMEMPEVDPGRVGATGGSQGGGLTLACAALEPRLRRAAPIYPFLCDYRRVWEMDLAKDAYGELREFFRRFDPRHEREEEIFRKLGYIDCQHLAHRVRAEVLMFTGLMDQICPPSSQFAAYNHLRSAKRMVLYPDFEHEELPGSRDLIFEFLRGL